MSNTHSHTKAHSPAHSHPPKHSHEVAHADTRKHTRRYAHLRKKVRKRVNKKKSNKNLIIAGGAIVLFMVITIVAIDVIKHHKLNEEREKRTKEQKGGPLVKTSIAVLSPRIKELVLIGEARPYEQATVYSKISGYLEKIYVDKGDTITEGQLLAYVDNPEIDKQYRSAVADYEDKKKIAERDQKLLARNFIAQEQADISKANADIAAANVKSMAEQQQYKYLKAPFSGIITARYVDPGAMIQNADNAQTSSQPVVSISELKRLRVYIYVEQHDADFLKTGDTADITLSEKPGMHIKGQITRMADQLDPHTRMMLGEVDIENKNNIIVPGSYVQVHMKYVVDINGREITIPSVALIVHNDTVMVATVDKDSTLHFKRVKISANTGEEATISEGLTVGDRVALFVGESFKENQKVRVLPGQQPNPKISNQ